MSTAYVFDLDDTLLDTTAVKEEKARSIPFISPEQYVSFYEQYRVYKEAYLKDSGEVSLKSFIVYIADVLGLSFEQRAKLTTWEQTIPYKQYLFDSEHALIEALGVDDVYIVTREPDEAFQWMKIDACNFASFLDVFHIRVVPKKDIQFWTTLTEEMHELGHSTIVHVNDNPRELFDIICATNGEGIHLVLFNHGKYAHDAEMCEQLFVLAKEYPGVLDIAEDFDHMRSLLLDRFVGIEGRGQGKER